MTKYCVILAIMDMTSANSDVIGQKKKYVFAYFCYIKKWQKQNKNGFKMYKPKLYWIQLEFQWRGCLHPDNKVE